MCVCVCVCVCMCVCKRISKSTLLTHALEYIRIYHNTTFFQNNYFVAVCCVRNVLNNECAIFNLHCRMLVFACTLSEIIVTNKKKSNCILLCSKRNKSCTFCVMYVECLISRTTQHDILLHMYICMKCVRLFVRSSIHQCSDDTDKLKGYDI
jgi:hypothetical protein